MSGFAELAWRLSRFLFESIGEILRTLEVQDIRYLLHGCVGTSEHLLGSVELEIDEVLSRRQSRVFLEGVSEGRSAVILLFTIICDSSFREMHTA